MHIATLALLLPVITSHVSSLESVRSEDSRLLSDVDELGGLVERWTQAMTDLGVPGCSIAVVMDGELLGYESIGIRNPAGELVNEDTLFYIASCTKTFTAGALARMADKRLLDMDASVQSLLPRFQLADVQAAKSITVRDLLCHRHGLNSTPIVLLDAYTGQITEDRYYHWMAKVMPAGVGYTNVNLTLAGRVLQAVSGKPWQEALAQDLFQACGMRRTTAYASRMYADPNCAFPMEGRHGAYRACEVRKTDSTMHAAGGTGTSARDGARWIAMHMNEGLLDDDYVLEPETAQAMATQIADIAPTGSTRRITGYGLGWHVGTYRGRPYATHGGGYIGTATHFSYLPEHGLGMVVLTNAAPAGVLLIDVISIDIYDRLLGETGHVDILPSYRRRARELLADQEGSADSPGTVAAKLELELEAYIGNYAAAELGDLVVGAEGGELIGHLGRLPLSIRVTDAKSLVLDSAAFNSIPAVFDVDSGHVRALEIELAGEAIRFARCKQ